MQATDADGTAATGCGWQALHMSVASPAPLQSGVRQLRLTWQSRIHSHAAADAWADQHLMQRREIGDRAGDLATLLLEAIRSLRAVKLPLDPGLIQSLSHGPLSGLSAWVEVSGVAPSLCWKALLLQPILI
jgi:hypothetical protein